jgi:peptide-methionine (S)-S-oxide reductase
MPRHLLPLFKTASAIVVAFALAACIGASGTASDGGDVEAAATAGATYAALETAAPGQAVAVFAGGCFWCAEHDLQKVEGVISVQSGYTGGRIERPSYEQVSTETTGHYEAVRVIYDPARLPYRTLVDKFLRSVDPTDAGGQFCDRGESYRTAIFVATADERAQADAAKAAVTLAAPIVTPTLDAAPFYPAEVYHQDYSEKNPVRYNYYRTGCGRDARVKEVWRNR